MGLVIRPYRDSDRDGFAHVKSRVYRGGAPFDQDEAVLRPDCFGSLAELDGNIVAVQTEIDMTCTVRRTVLPCAGIAAVGVLPEHRRGGIGLEMLTGALPFYVERGWAMAALMPYRAQYYRRAGYGTAGSRQAMSCPTHRLPSFDSELEIWEVPAEDYAAVVPCYEAYAKRFSGMNFRREGQWYWQLGGDNRLAIYAAGNPVQAFASTRLKVDFWIEQELRDLAWTSIEGYKAIFAFLKRLCINKTGLKWWEHSSSPMRWRFDDQGIESKFDGPMMYRILDVPAVLSAVRSEESGEFCFTVDDPHLEQNRGAWTVRFSSGGTEVAKGGQPAFELSIAALTQAALGEPSFETLLAMGEVRPLDASGLQSAVRFFRPFPTFTLDFF
jgi:predicted acetyltransferase